ncbi:sphinganine-1-phosphate aldolase [Saprolegnia diclina VS20]|uniref:sphinganine-1-phosphate aldolase n=1 Tax=Saprolegnia diclina (strain VS20) TaxID=1156394 RepID=T0Q9S3_SAPDV|nr:sphinganine-1-phosphate aldolase [Saprolegnia diclina VS20]EQC34659.1 sphinganine-1-phosphate aldolase [Saprolegnia diclina VS20]|eukprot:XP_008612065.1 sphinganine-1-phosphate aldolase [Saprolegnia diclina VS20]
MAAAPTVAAAVVASYVVLGRFMHIERVAKKGLPAALAGVLYYRYRAHLTGDAPSSVLALALAAMPPVMAFVLGDAIALVTLIYVAYAVLDRLRKARYGFSKKEAINKAGNAAMAVLSYIPLLQKKVRAEIAKIEHDIERSLAEQSKSAIDFPKRFALPEKGQAAADVLATMVRMVQGEDKRWQDGLVSGAVYHGEDEHIALLNQAYGLFAVTNPLHADLWPSVVRFEAEVIAMTASLLNGGSPDVVGSLTSGGTESIVLATKTHRDWFRHDHGITRPEIIAAVTAHAAIDKACDMFNIKLIKVPVDPITYKVNLDAVRWNISANTIMLYASAPNFPQGTIDDIAALSEMATQYGIGLHVDACLGGFVLPFARILGHKLPPFDFALPGVTSMSCDTHKYGYASKGTSVVLYKHKAIRRFQYFAYSDWTGGLYATPTIAGSRPGALSAAAWASMVKMGKEGYLEKTEGILETVEIITNGIRSMGDALFILGDPQAMVICFGSHVFNILKVSDRMSKAGWSLNALQHPTSVHLCVTVRHIGKGAQFLSALREAVDFVMADPNGKLSGGSAIYGMASTMPAGPVEDILRIYTDATQTL